MKVRKVICMLIIYFICVVPFMYVYQLYMNNGIYFTADLIKLGGEFSKMVSRLNLHADDANELQEEDTSDDNATQGVASDQSKCLYFFSFLQCLLYILPPFRSLYCMCIYLFLTLISRFASSRR